MGIDEGIYLDYAAATPVDEQVLDAMLPYFSQDFANPSASYTPARQVHASVEDARARIAHLMGGKAANIVFTAGATEANNLALTAAAPGAHVIASAIEHASMRSCVLARENGSLVPVDAQGFVSPDTLKATIRSDTELVSIALANGEIGTIQPLRELAQVVGDERTRRLAAGDMRPIYLHTDASQAAALKTLNVSSLGADLVTVSAAKMYGPKQMGLLWVRSGIELRPLVCGGGQEAGLRSGTENVPGIIGFARAFELARERREGEARRLRELRDWLQATLTAAFADAVVAGPTHDAHRLDNLLHISFPGLLARRLVISLDQRGVYVGTGSACAASKMTVSPVLEAIGVSPEVAEGSVRITLGHDTTREQVERAAQIIIEVVRAEMKRVSMA